MLFRRRERAARPFSQRLPARLRRWVWRWRHAVVVVALALAVHGVVSELRPAPPASHEVVVASQDLQAGTRLQQGDLRMVDMPASLAAPAMLRAGEEAVGQRLGVAMPRGQPLTSHALGSAGLAAGAPTGRAVVPVPLADPALAELLDEGQHIDLVAVAEPSVIDSEARVVAREALVLGQVPAAEGLGPLNTTEPVARVLVAVREHEAVDVVAAGAAQPLQVLLGE